MTRRQRDHGAPAFPRQIPGHRHVAMGHQGAIAEEAANYEHEALRLTLSSRPIR